MAVKLVEGASVDSYVYDYLAATNPSLIARTKIIHRSPPHGITPVVVRKEINGQLKGRLRKVFLDMDQDPGGSEILKNMMIRRFVVVSDSLFNSIREMKGLVERHTLGMGNGGQR